jgi:hypothetical protein
VCMVSPDPPLHCDVRSGVWDGGPCTLPNSKFSVRPLHVSLCEPSELTTRQESAPRNFQGVRRNLVMTGGKVSPPNMAATARTLL